MEDLCSHFLTDYPKFIHLEARDMERRRLGF